MDRPSKTDQTVTDKVQAATRHARDGRFDEAITALKEILAEDPRHEISRGMLAAIYLQLGMHEKACAHFEQLLEINPGNPLARFQLGMAHFSAGEAERAIATWEDLLAQEGEFMAHFHTGLALLQLAQPERAREMFEAAKLAMPASHPLLPQLEALLAGQQGGQ